MSHVCGEPQLPVSLREPGKSVTRWKSRLSAIWRSGSEKGSEPGGSYMGRRMFSQSADLFLNAGVENRACAKRNVVHRLGSHRS